MFIMFLICKVFRLVRVAKVCLVPPIASNPSNYSTLFYSVVVPFSSAFMLIAGLVIVKAGEATFDEGCSRVTVVGCTGENTADYSGVFSSSTLLRSLFSAKELANLSSGNTFLSFCFAIFGL